MSKWLNTGNNLMNLDSIAFITLCDNDIIVQASVETLPTTIYSGDKAEIIYKRLIEKMSDNDVTIINLDDLTTKTWATSVPMKVSRKTLCEEYEQYKQYKNNPFASTAVSVCKECYNNPANGGSGICHCILGTPEIT